MLSKEVNSFERKKQLFERANANLQRRRREIFLASLPSDLRSYLELCDCVYSPDAHVILERFYPIAENSVGYRDKISPVGYLFRETCKADDALAVAEQFGSSHDGSEGLRLLNSPVEMWLEERSDAVLVPDLPLFHVSFGWGRQSYSYLWRHSAHFITLVRADLVAGLIIDHYSGKKYVVDYRGVEWNRVIWKDGGYLSQPYVLLKCKLRDGSQYPYDYREALPASEVQIVKCGPKNKPKRAGASRRAHNKHLQRTGISVPLMDNLPLAELSPGR